MGGGEEAAEEEKRRRRCRKVLHCALPLSLLFFAGAFSFCCSAPRQPVSLCSRFQKRLSGPLQYLSSPHYDLRDREMIDLKPWPARSRRMNGGQGLIACSQPVDASILIVFSLSLKNSASISRSHQMQTLQSKLTMTSVIGRRGEKGGKSALLLLDARDSQRWSDNDAAAPGDASTDVRKQKNGVNSSKHAHLGRAGRAEQQGE